MTDERIINGLTAQFERHRLVFWYDAKQEMRETFDALDLLDVDAYGEELKAALKEQIKSGKRIST